MCELLLDFFDPIKRGVLESILPATAVAGMVSWALSGECRMVTLAVNTVLPNIKVAKVEEKNVGSACSSGL